MSRNPKLEVAAVNLRIPSTKARNYKSLIKDIASLKQGVKVYGDTFVAIQSFNENDNSGLMVKYTQINVDGNWFDLEKFDEADPKDIKSITIPTNLRPNHAAFLFYLDESLHTLVFSSYISAESISVAAVEKYFEYILVSKIIYERYGRVESSIINSYSAVSDLLDLSGIKEVKIAIRSPNSDDIDEALAKVIEDRLKKQNADEYEEIIRSKDNGSVKPDDRTKKLALIAAENGSVRVKAPIHGIMRWNVSSKTPLIEGEKYDSDLSDRAVFRNLANALLKKVRVARREARDE